MNSDEAKKLILKGKAPEGLQVDGNLYLYEYTSFKSLPQGLHVEGTLFLFGCTSLESLPQGLQVGKNLYLRGCTSLVIDHWDIQVNKVYWDEDVASRVPLEILPLMIAVNWGNEMSEKAYKKRLGGKQHASHQIHL